MKTIDMIIKSSTEFYNDLKADEHDRYRSWEHCYSHFMTARKENDVNLDYLSLQLAFYLASWGMYRGSSFLLQKDYRVHIPVVREILSNIYDSLAGIECKDFKNETNQKLLKEINEFIANYYDEIRREVRSSALITKILMGTLGCVPAYDRYFVKGIRSQKIASGTYNIKSILQLVDFYEKNIEQLDSVQKNFNVADMLYPQMKILDMGFWQIGFDQDSK